MKFRIVYFAVFPVLLFCNSAALAGDMFVYGTVGSRATVGIGKALSESFSVRAGIGSGLYGLHDRDINGIHYDIKPQSNISLSAILDWYPIAGSGFRVSGGVVYANDQSQNLTATTDSVGGYRINGNTYSAAEVGQLRGKTTFRNWEPYIGIGWESAAVSKPGWRFISDLGLQFKTGGVTSLSAAGGTGNAALQQDVDAERRRVASDFNGTHFSLGFSVGAAYSF